MLPPAAPSDVVVTWLKRTAMTKAKRGGFKDTSSDHLLFSILQGAHRAAGADLVEDIAVGQCHAPSPCYEARAAALAAGFHERVPVVAINRLCGSGLMAIRSISDSIARGDIEVGLAVGVESMSSNARPTPSFKSEEILRTPASKDCTEPMGWTSEMVGKDFKIPRSKMDEFALASHTRASHASKSGLFKDEILPVETHRLDEAGKRVKVTVSHDDGIRHGTALTDLRKARSAFSQWGDLSTGGNSSQMTDGAAACLLMRRSKAEELGLPILARHLGTTVVGVTPKHMGTGPVPAIRKLLDIFKVAKEDIAVWEINEAFATMYVYCVEELGLDLDKVNINGGAIALGHPLGATGVRQVVTGLAELKRRQGQLMVTSMCIGSGMGAAALWLNEGQGRVAKL